MKLTLSIPDDTFEQYVAQSDKNNVKSEIVDRLVRFADVTPKTKIVELTAEHRARLHELLDRTISSADDVVRAVEDIVRFDVGEFVYHFKTEDLEILSQQAEYWDKPLDEYVVDMMEQFVQFATNQN